ncbi:MAG: ribonuclease HIII [Ignavibacteriales bacterium]|nr:ribonuclease HIII [Ignavibacteriales bacterium]
MEIEDKAKKQIESLRLQCEKEGLFNSQLSKKDYNYEFTVNSGKEKIKVQVYFGKKGIKTILQGDLKSNLYKKLNNLILDEPKLDLNDSSFIEPVKYIGSDECGKGDFFGPLVVAAVFVNEETKKQLTKVGVRDSKDLSDNMITLLAKEIKHIIGENFEIVRVNPHKYNELYKQFNNLNKLLNWAHSKAIDNLLDNTMCKFVITDKFSKKELDVVSLSKHSDVEFIQETKAEKYIGVAAASILARNSFVDWFESHSRKGLVLPKGSSIETEKFAKKLLQKIGEEKLSELGKLHFKTFAKIK